jgi:sulfur-oxidizing protein SoxY
MLFSPARFVDRLDVKKGEDLVMTVEGGISLSEDPNIRFFYRTDAAGDFTVLARDTDQKEFAGSWPAKPNS